jgi:hypothetical protein
MNKIDKDIDYMQTVIENNRCECCNDLVTGKMHICPFREDIHGDSETLCNCCGDCEHQCCMDI